MLRTKVFFILFSLIIAVPALALGRTDLLGSTILSNRQDVDFIRVNSCKDGHEFVSAVKLKVLRDNADIEAVIVKFGNGETQELAIRERFSRGSESRWVDLAGFRRCIRGVKVVGDSGARLRRTVVEIYGLVEAL